MANLPESSTFDAGVYQIETTDPVIGGPSGVTNTPLKNLANRTKYLKDQVDSLATNKAPLASPAFTGTPTVPTAAAGTNTTQAASTAFVSAAVSAAAPNLTPYAPKASPVFTGNPVAPTPAEFDYDTSLATTQFVRDALGCYSGRVNVTAGRSIAVSDIGMLMTFSMSANITMTFPQPTSVDANIYTGAAITLHNTTNYNVTIVPGSGATLNNPAGFVSSAVIKPAQSVTMVVVNSTTWNMINSTAELGVTADFASSKAESGYQKLPGGLIIQFGLVGLAGTQGTITYPVAFPNAVISAVCTILQGTSTATLYSNVYSIASKTQLTIQSSAAGYQTAWAAIGY